MIITRSPLRISLGGGGTDLPSYYREHGGFLVAGALDKYVYLTLHRTFVPDLIVKYSKLERVADAAKLEHPIIREAFGLLGLNGHSLELSSMADIPSGTGLGSSGSFTTALLKVLHASNKNLISAKELAEQACHLEIDRLGEPVGKQDQYIAAVGGITAFTFHKDGRVEFRPCKISEETLFNSRTTCCSFSPATRAPPPPFSRTRTTNQKNTTRRCSTTCTSRRSSATSRSTPSSRPISLSSRG